MIGSKKVEINFSLFYNSRLLGHQFSLSVNFKNSDTSLKELFKKAPFFHEEIYLW